MKKSLVVVFTFSCFIFSSYAMDAGSYDYDKAGLLCVQSLLGQLCEKNIDDDRKAAFEEISAAIENICACEKVWGDRSFRKTPARLRELSGLFTQLGDVLEEQMPSLLIIDQHEGVSRNYSETSMLIDSAVQSVRDQAQALTGKNVRSINTQTTAQVLVEVLKVLMQIMDVLDDHVAKMPLTNETQIAQHDALQWWGIRMGAVGIVIYLALFSCNTTGYCNVPLPSLTPLLAHFSAFKTAA